MERFPDDTQNHFDPKRSEVLLLLGPQLSRIPRRVDTKGEKDAEDDQHTFSHNPSPRDLTRTSRIMTHRSDRLEEASNDQDLGIERPR